MIKKNLTLEEKEIMESIEKNEFIPVTGAELKSVADAIAARKKDATLTVRVNSKDINQIKRMAQKKGIRYQTYISEIIHRVAQSL